MRKFLGIIIVLIIIFTYIGCNESNDVINKINPQEITINTHDGYKDILIENNYVHTSVALLDEWVYYYSNKHIYKVSYDGSDHILLLDLKDESKISNHNYSIQVAFNITKESIIYRIKLATINNDYVSEITSYDPIFYEINFKTDEVSEIDAPYPYVVPYTYVEAYAILESHKPLISHVETLFTDVDYSITDAIQIDDLIYYYSIGEKSGFYRCNMDGDNDIYLDIDFPAYSISSNILTSVYEDGVLTYIIYPLGNPIESDKNIYNTFDPILYFLDIETLEVTTENFLVSE